MIFNKNNLSNDETEILIMALEFTKNTLLKEGNLLESSTIKFLNKSLKELKESD